jgi:hypothetical protein
MKSAMAAIGIAVIVAACGSLPPPTTAPAPTPTLAATPIPTPTPLPAMAVGHLARVAAAGGAQPWTKAGGKGTKLEPLPMGAILYLIASKRASDGTTWWQVPAQGYEGPTGGWVAEAASDGSTVLEPENAACPAGGPPRSASDLPSEPWFRPACYGHDELKLEGSVTCQQSSGDSGLQGAPWMDAYRGCVLDDILRLNGPAVTSLLDADTGGSVRARHAVLGHFDDPGSAHCVGTPFGVSLGSNAGPGEAAAIALCQQQFVVTELLPASGG